MSDYNNKGIFFKNNFKEKDSQPDYKGKLNVEGKDFDLAGWIRDGAKGKFISLSISEPYNKESAPQADPQAEEKDSLPF